MPVAIRGVKQQLPVRGRDVDGAMLTLASVIAELQAAGYLRIHQTLHRLNRLNVTAPSEALVLRPKPSNDWLVLSVSHPS
jgi:hypothetical protein